MGPPPYFDTQEGYQLSLDLQKQSTTLMAPSTNTKGSQMDCIDYAENLIVEHTSRCHGEVVAPPPNGHQEHLPPRRDYIQV